MQNQHNDDVVIACNVGAIDSNVRDQHMEIAGSIFASVIEIKELEDGFGFQLPLETPLLYKATQWIANERLCCSFFTFKMVVGEQFWIELSGTDDVKAFIHASIVTPLLESGSLPDKDAWLAKFGVAEGG